MRSYLCFIKFWRPICSQIQGCHDKKTTKGFKGNFNDNISNKVPSDQPGFGSSPRGRFQLLNQKSLHEADDARASPGAPSACLK
jgi:hypothetical protein